MKTPINQYSIVIIPFTVNLTIRKKNTRDEGFSNNLYAWVIPGIDFKKIKKDNKIEGYEQLENLSM